MTTTTDLKLISSAKCFGGLQNVYEHYSNELKCTIKFAAFLPKVDENDKVKVLIWLSGLTCNEQNFITKSGFQRYAQEHKITVICPDTSPRGCNIEGESDRWDFGVGAGFYVDATEPKWKNNYRMYTYINYELHEVIKHNFNKGQTGVFDLNVSIFGHSMGGHGALVSYFTNPSKYKSVSAFAPICNPVNCEWGKFAFKGYLGDDEEKWKEYDATCLINRMDETDSKKNIKILIDQGTDDSFLKQKQLLPENLAEAAKKKWNLVVDLRYQEGYDHSYFFIASFIEDHFKFHSEYL